MATLLLLAACENPSGLPDGFGDDGASDPTATPLRADSAFLAPLDDFTGAFVSNTGFTTFRLLAGQADDPDFGAVTALGYIDVLAPATFPEGFRDRPVEEVTLRLVRDYVYGDTLLPTVFDLRQVAEEWNAIGSDGGSVTSDTLFPVQDEIITSFEVAGDSLVEVAMPEDWIAANDTTLRSTQFSTLFHGFQLRAQDGSTAAYGFTGASSLELISDGDTVRYQASELFSNIEAEPPTVPLGDGVVRLQDGTGLGLELNFDLGALGRTALNTAFVRVDVGETPDAQPGFARPVAEELALFGLPGPDSTNSAAALAPLFLASATRDEDGQTFSFNSAALTAVLQQLVLGTSRLEGFAIGFPTAPPSLDVVPLLGLGGEARGPRAVLVLIPGDG